MTGIGWLDWLLWLSGVLTWVGIVGAMILMGAYFKDDK